MKKTSITFCLAALIATICSLSFHLATAQSWTYISGIEAQDVAVGKNGSVWATGKNHAIYRLNGSSWQTMPGGGERIAVDPQGDAWVLSLDGAIWKYNSTTNDWQQKPGSAKDIGIGADGTVWVIGTGSTGGGYLIYKWSGSNWTNIPGGAVRIAVDPSGNAWVINNTNTIFRYNGSGWDLKPGAAKDIGVGANGTVWCTAPDDRIYLWDGANWNVQTGAASQVSVGPDGTAWVVNSAGYVHKSNTQATGSSALLVSGVQNVAAPAAVITTAATNSQSTSTVQAAAPKPTSGDVEFENIGRLPVKVYKSSSSALGDLVTEIRPQSTTKIATKIGDEFEVKVVDQGKEKEGYQPKIYINDIEDRIYLYGNVPMSDFAGKSGFALKTVDYAANMIGVDEAKLNYDNLVMSLNNRQVFESLDEVSGADYVSAKGRLMKFGFDFVSTNLKMGEFKSHMSYGYSSFASGWNLSLSGKAPLGPSGADLGGDFAYGEKEKETRSSTNIYTYSREEASQYTVTVDKYKARLHPEFKQAVRSVKTAADVKKKIIDIYGTHFITTITYGGERAAYMRMTSDEYTKAKSMNMNIKASVATALTKQTDKNIDKLTDKSTKEDGTETTSGGYGGSISFGYDQSSEQASVLKNTKSQYRMLGGSGGFDNWSISEDNSVPISLKLEKIYELVDPKCFKDNTSADLLAQKKALIKQAVEDYLRTNMPPGSQSGIKTPAPKVYEVTLTKMEVTEEVDDANKNTKGSISIAAYDDSKAQVANQGGDLWHQDSYSTDFEFKKGKIIYPNVKKYFTQFPQNGAFKSFYININGEILEKDDLWDIGRSDWSYGAMRGGTGDLDLNGMGLQEGTPVEKSFEVSYWYTAANLGKVKLTYTIMLMPSEFDMQLF